MAADAVCDLGCCEILREIIQFRPEDVFAKHGYWWDAGKLVNILVAEHGFQIKTSDPEPGDIVLSGDHPGIVLPGGKVAHRLRGRRLVTDMSNWSIGVVLCRKQ